MINYASWNKFDKDNPSKLLVDHFYYLVAHKDYGTPMKAKWHEELGGCWEVFIGNGRQNEEIYPWDDPYPIVAWMYLPTLTDVRNLLAKKEV